MNPIHYNNCPLCNSASINPLLIVKDHSVSKEEFTIWQCATCTLRFTQNVPDEETIAPYYQSQDYISHSNTSKGLLNKLYQKVRHYTLNEKAKLIQQHTMRAGNILDIGAGTGAFLSVMKNKGWKIKGIEPDAGARSKAKELFDLQLEEPTALKTLEKEYDAITLWHVLEHVHALHDYVEKLKAILLPGGKIFIAVPNYTSGDADAYKNFWAAYDVPRHLYHFTPKSIEKLMELHGLQVKAVRPMWFDAFYISLLSSKYQWGKTAWISAGLNGLISNAKALLNKTKCSSLIYIIEAKS